MKQILILLAFLTMFFSVNAIETATNKTGKKATTQAVYKYSWHQNFVKKVQKITKPFRELYKSKLILLGAVLTVMGLLFFILADPALGALVTALGLIVLLIGFM